ncbi:MAG: hypothetical protein AB8B64_15685 [Granulosicoccus sp.]
MNTTLLQLEHTDTVTGLPTRSAFAVNLQRWLVSQPDGMRFVAVNISLPTVRGQSGSKGIDGTLQDLLAYRASVLLAHQTWQNTLLGRADRQSLLLAQRCRQNTAGCYRSFLRGLLGNLGGLIDDPGSIAVTTLVSTVSMLSAHEVLQRLQFRATTECLNVNGGLKSVGLHPMNNVQQSTV